MLRLTACARDCTGVKQNAATAFGWYSLAAEQNHPFALINLGVCYELGQGVKQHFELAVACYQRAAEMGHATAQVCG